MIHRVPRRNLCHHFRVNLALAGLVAMTMLSAWGATLTVTTVNDTGAGSLREAIQTANLTSGASVIGFAPALAGQTITLTSGQLTLTNNVQMSAASLTGGISFSGNGTSRVLQVLPGATVSLTAITIRNGLAPNGTYPANSGGGILNQGTLTLTNCLVTGNQATQGPEVGGGGIENNGGQLALYNSTIANNLGGIGGGLDTYPAAATTIISQCTIAGNTATQVGGGCYSEGTLLINQSTVAGNASAQSFGGIDQFGGTCTLNNSIVAGNTQASGTNLAGTFNFTGKNLTNGTPILAPLGNYGGLTPTMPPLPGSPALDAAVGTTFATDQRGFPRLVGQAADLGAVEGVFALSVTNLTRLGNGSVQLKFGNLTGLTYTVLASTNLAAPLNTWANLGRATESAPGQFQFTDAQAASFPRRFYRVTTP